MADLTKLSGPKLHAEIAKRKLRYSAALDASIAAGQGAMRHSDILELAKGSNLLHGVRVAKAYLDARAAWCEAEDELDARKAYHGGDKPIRRLG